MAKEFLYPHQRDAVSRMRNGCILNGGVGSGKSRTALYYYFQKNGGSIIGDTYTKMKKKPPDLYIITTAAKRDKLEWEKELIPFLMYPGESLYSNTVVIDSWNNIVKYKNVKNAFFIFDEDRVTGYGTWAKTFISITKSNEWIVLSATPGDDWKDYISVFVANGFYRNKTQFENEHIVYDFRVKKFPKIKKYLNIDRLIRLRERILVDMEFDRHTVPHHEDVVCSNDISLARKIMKTRWDPLKQKPIESASDLCYILRKIANMDESRQVAILEIFEKHPKLIIFYSFDYERDILLNLGYGDDVVVAEWSGHAHEPIPESDSWVYLVNYNAGAEGWNTIKTNAIAFYSQTYSYKTLVQACGRIDRLNTKFVDLYYYHLKCKNGIDVAISEALKNKKKFNERQYVG